MRALLLCALLPALARHHGGRNFTLERRSGAPSDPAVGRVLLLVTAAPGSAAGSDHLGELRHLWPLLLRRNPAMRAADLLLHVLLSPSREPTRADEDCVLAIERIARSFPNRHIRAFFFDNPGYHAGAIRAMQDGVRQGWFEGYDWCV